MSLPDVAVHMSWPYIIGLWSFIAILIVAATFVYNARWHPIASVPGPLLARISPFWMAWALWRNKFSIDLCDLHTKYGPIVRIGPNEISFSTVDSLETIYHGNLPKTGHFLKANQEIFNILLPGPSIFTAHETSEHRKMRKKIEPALSAKALLKQDILIRQHIESTCQDVERRIDSRKEARLNIADLISTNMFNLVSDLAFGEPLVKGRKSFEAVLENLGGLLVLYEVFGFILPFIEGFLRYLLATIPSPLTGMDFIQPERLRAQMIRSEGRGDFLAAIMEDQRSTGVVLTDPELQGNSIFMFVAGYTTSSVTLSAVLYHILREPQHMLQLRDEIRNAFSNSEDIDNPKLQQLSYLNACINEALRLVPPLNLRFASRVSPGAMVSGLYVPKGVVVSSDIFTMQRSEKFWACASEFRPERWIDNGPGTLYFNDNKATFKPFLLGERLCPGKQMFYHTARLVLAHLILQFDLELLDKDDFVWERDVRGTGLWLDYQRINVCVTKSGARRT